MKKLCLLGLLAVGGLLVIERPAQAWINSKLAIGLSWHWQSGCERDFWNMFCNGGHHDGPVFGGYSEPYPLAGGGAGLDHLNYGPHVGKAPPAPANTATARTPTAPPVTQPAGYFNTSYRNAPVWQSPTLPYQPAAYQPGYGPPTYTPGALPGGYGQPGAGAYYPGYYGYYQPPSYWYGYGR